MFSTKVYFVMKMYFHTIHILYYMILNAIFMIVITFSILIHRCYPLSALHCRCYLTNVAVSFANLSHLSGHDKFTNGVSF